MPKNNTLSKDSFMILKGSKYVDSKMKQMMHHTKKTISIVTTYPGIMQAYNTGIFETAFSHPQVDKIIFQFLISLEDSNVEWSMLNELYNKSKQVSMPVKVHIGDLGKINSPRYIIADDSEVLFSLYPPANSPYGDKTDVGLWTDNKIVVRAFRAFFKDGWGASVDFTEQFQSQ